MQVNLDTYDDVAKDYRFYEDPGDEFRNPPDGVSQTKNKQKVVLSFKPNDAHILANQF